MTFDTAQAAFDFYVDAINRHCFDALEQGLFAQEACCRFDGEVHRGLGPIRTAFEAAWARLPDEDYRMSEPNWLVNSDVAAVVAFVFAYSGHDGTGRLNSASGTGINVYVRTPKGFRLIYEDLTTTDISLGGVA